MTAPMNVLLLLLVILSVISSSRALWIPLHAKGSAAFPALLVHRMTPNSMGEYLKSPAILPAENPYFQMGGNGTHPMVTNNVFSSKVLTSSSKLYPTSVPLEYARKNYGPVMQDVAFYKGLIYAAMNPNGNTSDAVLLVIQASDLSFTGRVIHLSQPYVSWIAIHQETGMLYSSDTHNVTTIYEYEVPTNNHQNSTSNLSIRLPIRRKLPLERRVHVVESGVLIRDVLHLRVNRGIDSECNAFVARLPSTLDILNPFHWEINPYSGQNLTVTNNNTVIKTLSYTTCSDPSQAAQLSMYLANHSVPMYWTSNWSISHMIIKRKVTSNLPKSLLRERFQEFNETALLQTYLYIEKEIPGLNAVRMMFQCDPDNITECSGGLATPRQYPTRIVKVWRAGPCPFKDVPGSPCQTSGNPCIGTGKFPPIDQQKMCKETLDVYCSTNSTDSACSRQETIDFDKECPFLDVPGSPCYTAGNACLVEGPESSNCAKRVLAYCFSITEALSDTGCLSLSMQPVNETFVHSCPFNNTRSGSPCSASANVCFENGSVNEEKCHRKIETYCYTGNHHKQRNEQHQSQNGKTYLYSTKNQSAYDMRFPNEVHWQNNSQIRGSVNASLRSQSYNGYETGLQILPDILHNEPGCVKQSWRWWFKHSTCPFGSLKDSPCERNSCVRLFCDVRLMNGTFSCNKAAMANLFDDKSNLQSTNISAEYRQGQQLHRDCVDIMNGYCRHSIKQNDTDPFCWEINRGCGPSIESCPFQAVPGSPCCRSESKCLKTTEWDAKRNATECMTSVKSYCELNSSANESLDTGCSGRFRVPFRG